MKNHVSTLFKDDLGELVKTFRIPLNLHPHFPDPTLTMDRLPQDTIGFIPTVTLFCVFQILCKRGDWFPFAKRQNTEDVCMDNGPSSLKKWKNKVFLIDRRAILDYLTWRHSHFCVSNDLPVDGYNQNDVERLCVRLICLREIKEELFVRSEMSIYEFMTLPSWGDAKVVEEPHYLPAHLLDRVSPHTAAPVAEGALIPLPTLDEVAATQPDPRLAKRKLKRSASEVGSSVLEVEETKGLDGAGMSDFYVELENSLERDEGTSARVDSVPVTRLGKRLGPSHSLPIVSVSEQSYIGTSARAFTSGGTFAREGMLLLSSLISLYFFEFYLSCFRLSCWWFCWEAWSRRYPLDALARSALSRDAKYVEIPEDDFATASRGEEIDLTFFPLLLVLIVTSRILRSIFNPSSISIF
ncbi:hypothetical protein Tco_0469366 [Tanacetum coccineum]